MTQPTEAFLIRVQWDDKHSPSGGMTMLYACVVPTEAEALEAVKKVRPAGDRLSIAEGRLSAETTQALKLALGHARPL